MYWHLMEQSLEQALGSFDRKAATERRSKAEEIRREILTLFPIENWATLPLERYALGQEDSSNTFCRWLEFKSSQLGSISGGSSHKHIIFKHRTKPGWHYPQQFTNEREAWEKLRADVVTMLKRASEGNWDELPELLPFQYATALWLKALHIYFPHDVLAVYSRDHLAHFRYRLSGEKPRASRKTAPISLNRGLLDDLRSRPGLADLSPIELAYFLYHWDDPRAGTSIYKIAPGEDAKYWDECLQGEYVCVGWPAVGDLEAFEDFAAFSDRFQAEYAKEYGDTPAGRATLTRKAKELWRLTQIQPDDRIIANKGMSHILAVGEVRDPTYEFAGEQIAYPHRIRVRWDTSQARSIPPQQQWAFVTVAPVPLEEYERLMSGGGNPPPPPPDPELAQLGERLEERKQLILYGPPGTGKTYTARRFLLH
jgi:5-methylcytosine-specific restriction enzyme B